MDVLVLNRQRRVRVAPRPLATFLERLAGAVPPPSADSMALCLVSDREMRQYNRRYRGKNFTTDVLSFAADSAEAPDGERHLGDIVISVPKAEEQAREARHSLARELKLLALHGYLHLMGFDHETDDGEMLSMERRLVRRLLPAAQGDGS